MTSPSNPTDTAAFRPSPGRVAALVVGCLLALAGLAALTTGAALGWAYGTQRDDDGWFTSSTERLETPTAALTSDEVVLGTDPGPGWFPDDLASVRIEATGAAGTETFVGIGPERDVEAYLAEVAHDEVRSIDADPFSVTYRRDGGSVVGATPPTEETFWVATDSGSGTRRVEWELERGRWAAVVMNADGTTAVAADVTVGVKSDLVLPLAVGAGVMGAALAVLATVLIVVGAHGLAPAATGPSSSAGATAAPTSLRPNPVRVNAQLDPDLSRWQWLVKWLLVVPHLVVLVFLWIAFPVLTLVAGVAILFTGRYPRRIFDVNVGILRWSWRVGYYATSVLGTDRYPPFTLAAVPEYPASLEIAYPEHLNRWLVLVKWWLLALPHYIVLAAVSGGDTGWGAGLLATLVLIAAIALLFTGRYPQGLFDLVLGLHRWMFRLVAYVALMTDVYPPFRLDQGGDEPGEGPADPPNGPMEPQRSATFRPPPVPVDVN